MVALSESLAVVGLVVPGAAIMIAAGALIALNAMSFWPTMLLAVVGATAGDGISYWIGRRYRERLPEVWPFRRHREWLRRGERFFLRHGGKSIVLGRFVGPVRAFVPIVAGMLGMRPAVFYTMNILSAMAWAPAYLLPGMAFGASLALAGVVAPRLAVLFVVLGALVWLVWWCVAVLYRLLSPRAASMAQSVMAWGRSHPRVNSVLGGLLDSSRPEFATLVVMAFLLIGAAWLFLGLLEDVVTGDPLVRVDQGLHQLIQDLRTPWGDRIMVFVTELGDGIVIALVAAAVLVWFLWHRRWRTAGYWVAAIGFGQLAATTIKFLLQRPRPFADLYDGVSAYAFPSGHATMSTVVYGFLAVLVARSFASERRWLVYALATLLITAIAASRLYLGAHWLSDVLGGLSLGVAWVCLLGIAYYRHRLPEPLPEGLPAAVLLALIVVSGWHVATRYSIDLERYVPEVVVTRWNALDWWQGEWRQLPAYRQDLEGELEQPLDIQWSGTLSSLSAKLRSEGWREPITLSPSTALRWLLPDAQLSELPMLPQVHDGRHESLLMLGPPLDEAAPTGSLQNERLVLRLWNTGVVLDPNGAPLWIGGVYTQKPKHILLLTVPVIAHQYEAPLERFARTINDVEHRVVMRTADSGASQATWNGRVLLIR